LRIFAVFITIILFLLFIIRKYEKSQQNFKFREEKSRILEDELTRRLKLESDYKKTRLDYLEVLDSLQDGYVGTDQKGFITHVNFPFIRELGFSNKEEIIGKPFWHFCQKRYVKDVTDRFENLFETRQPQDRFETRFYGKDGKNFIGEAVLSPVFDQEELVGTKASIRNNTRRFKAEKELSVQKDFLDELLKQTPVAVVIMGTGNIISFVNPAFENLFGYGREEAMGSKLDSLLSSTELRVELKECSETYPGERLFMSGRRNKKDGSPIDVEVFAQRFFVGSQNYGRLVFYNDISIRIKAEEILKKAKEAVERDLEIGSEIQSGFFPHSVPKIPGWEISTYFKAARQVSGDFYDVFPIGKKGYLGMVVADVCDKGVGAALFMVLLRSLIRSYSEQYKDEDRVDDLLHQIAHKVNAYIVNIHGRSNMFATLVLGILDPAIKRLYYVNGGHDAPVLVDANGNIREKLKPTGPAFGFSTDMDFEIEKLDFLPGDLLLSFTDGLTEAKNMDGDFYSEERLFSQAAEDWSSAFSAVKHIELELSSHIGKQTQFDDITLVALRRSQQDETVCHRFTPRADLSHLPLFRDFVLEACLLLEVDDKISEALQLATDEVCSNVIIHGYKDMEDGEISLSVKQEENEIEVLVEDSGHPYDPTKIAPPDLSENIDERMLGGLGIFFVKEVGDSFLNLVTDLEGLNYSSSAGIRVFLGLARESRQKGGDLRIAAVQPQVDKIFKLSKFDRIVRVFQTVDEAVKSYRE